MIRRRGARGRPGLGPAGWLFSELALILMIIALGAGESRTTPASDPTATASGTSPSPTSTGTGTGTAVGLDVHSVQFTIQVPREGDSAAVVRAFERQLSARKLSDARVGIALLFGVAWNGVVLDGDEVSRRLAGVLRSAGLPQLQGTELRTYLRGAGGSADGSRRRPGDCDVELFIVTG